MVIGPVPNRRHRQILVPVPYRPPSQNATQFSRLHQRRQSPDRSHKKNLYPRVGKCDSINMDANITSIIQPRALPGKDRVQHRYRSGLLYGLYGVYDVVIVDGKCVEILAVVSIMSIIIRERRHGKDRQLICSRRMNNGNLVEIR